MEITIPGYAVDASLCRDGVESVNVVVRTDGAADERLAEKASESCP